MKKYICFFSKLKKKCPSDVEIEKTKTLNKIFNTENGEKSTKLSCITDVFLLTCVHESFIKVSINESDINPFFVFLSLDKFGKAV